MLELRLHQKWNASIQSVTVIHLDATSCFGAPVQGKVITLSCVDQVESPVLNWEHTFVSLVPL